MTFFGNLKAHEGGLIRIKTELYWRGPGIWDGVPERLCVLLGVGTSISYSACPGSASDATDRRGNDCYLHLLIDGRPAWIGLNKQSFEVIE